jgi:hypothetical protein
MLWGPGPDIISFEGVGAQKLFAAFGELSVAYSCLIDALSRGILGVPLSEAVIKFLRLSDRSDLVPAVHQPVSRFVTTTPMRG